jgi:hypothetical protein
MNQKNKEFIDKRDPQFTFKDCVIGGDECVLINPSSMATDWSDDNARFRSAIVRKSDGKMVSSIKTKIYKFWRNMINISYGHKIFKM